MSYYKITSDGQTLCLSCGDDVDGVLIDTADREGEILECEQEGGCK